MGQDGKPGRLVFCPSSPWSIGFPKALLFHQCDAKPDSRVDRSIIHRLTSRSLSLPLPRQRRDPPSAWAEVRHQWISPIREVGLQVKSLQRVGGSRANGSTPEGGCEGERGLGRGATGREGRASGWGPHHHPMSKRIGSLFLRESLSWRLPLEDDAYARYQSRWLPRVMPSQRANDFCVLSLRRKSSRPTRIGSAGAWEIVSVSLEDIGHW